MFGNFFGLQIEISYKFSSNPTDLFWRDNIHNEIPLSRSDIVKLRNKALVSDVNRHTGMILAAAEQ